MGPQRRVSSLTISCSCGCLVLTCVTLHCLCDTTVCVSLLSSVVLVMLSQPNMVANEYSLKVLLRALLSPDTRLREQRESGGSPPPPLPCSQVHPHISSQLHGEQRSHGVQDEKSAAWLLASRQCQAPSRLFLSSAKLTPSLERARQPRA